MAPTVCRSKSQTGIARKQATVPRMGRTSEMYFLNVESWERTKMIFQRVGCFVWKQGKLINYEERQGWF